ncbi:MAG: YegS/Rv2252/BmrU family lipid kinase [Salinivirgaceae bacterium]|nr:YegS/Rv2252/BmrU family lipid kinase [Salinivirgaceae bacterium]
MKIAFIVNPISGTHTKNSIIRLIHDMFKEPQYEVVIKKTRWAGHAITLANDLGKVYDVVVAVGGDGTLNEVAQGLLNTSAKFGIVPMGSGNGLARHLQIPINAKKALNRIKQNSPHLIDVLFFNDIPFMNVSGIGFDAKVAYNFAESEKRGLLSYLKQIVRLYFRFLPVETEFVVNNRTFKRAIWLIAIANSSQFGNNAVISPISDVSDGVFEVIILKPFPLWAVPAVVIRMFTKSMHRCKYIEIIQTQNVSIVTSKPIESHVDGTPYKMDTIFNVRIQQGALKVLI